MPFPAFDPIAFSIGPLAIRWYALAYIVGIVLGWWLLRRLASAQSPWGGGGAPLEPIDIDDYVVWATLGIIVGGRLGFVLFYAPGYFIQNPLQIFATWQGGMAFHGGFLGVVLATILFCRRRGIPLWSLLDLIAIAAPIGIFFGRIANFINGELWGRVADLPWAFVFPGAGPAPRHPSQLYEAALEGVLLFAILIVLALRFKALQRPGLLAGTFALGYGLTRSFAEQFREPDPSLGTMFGFLTMGVLLSLPMILAGLWAIRRALRPDNRLEPRTDTADG